MAATNYTDDTSILLSDAQELLQHIPRDIERGMLNPNLKPDVADKIVDALRLLRERVYRISEASGLRWHPLLGWIPKDSACFGGSDEARLKDAAPMATHSSAL